MSPPNHTPSSSSSSLEHLAFSYDQPSPNRDYPNSNQSQPPTPASIIPLTPPHRRSGDSLMNTMNSSAKGLDDEESLLRAGRSTNVGDIDMDPFEKSEWALISTSSILVVALIVAAVLMMLGKVSL